MVQVCAPEVVPAVPARRTGALRLLPALFAASLAVTALASGGVPLSDMGVFGAYVLLGLTVPGTLWWRALSGTPRSLAADVAAGTALGYALEVLTYIPARWLDVPYAYLAWAGATYLLFCTVPALRRHQAARGGTVRAPLGWSWAMAGLAGFSILYSAVTFFPGHGLTWPGNGAPYIDLPYHLAMAGDVKHHLPAMFANVAGEALHDHWYVYADLAATSWTTGLELQTLLYRLSPVPMIAAFTVLVGVLAHRLTGRWGAGVASVAAMFFVVAPDPYGWKGGIVSSAGEAALPWVSPTQTFGALLFAPLVLVLADLVRHPGGRHGRWVLVAVLMLAEAGAKATFLPLTLAGVTFVLVLHLIVHREVHRAAAWLTGLGLALVAFAQIVVFHGEDKGLRFAPLHFMRWHEAYRVSGAGLLLPGKEEAPVLVLLVVAIHVVSWAALWGGAACALRRWRPDRAEMVRRPDPARAGRWGPDPARAGRSGPDPAGLSGPDPAVVLLSGVGLAGIGAVCVFGHPGLSQGYFLSSAAPYLTVLAVAGLSPAWRRPWPLVLGAGAAAVWAVRAWSGVTPPQGAGVVAGRVVPYALLVGAAVAVALLLVLTGRRGQVWWALPVFALGAGLWTGLPQRLEPFKNATLRTTAPQPQGPSHDTGLRSGGPQLQGPFRDNGLRSGGPQPQGPSHDTGPRSAVPQPQGPFRDTGLRSAVPQPQGPSHDTGLRSGGPMPEPFRGSGLLAGLLQRVEARRDDRGLQIPEGGVIAARWLRDHSSPDALVAVNAHCRAPAGTCDARHFWISAYAERRILVEGWGYINGANSRAALLGPPTMGTVPFPFPRRLADNDAAFHDPSPETVGRLRDAYGVQWLFTDDRYPVRTSALGRVATLRFEAGHCRVYEIPVP